MSFLPDGTSGTILNQYSPNQNRAQSPIRSLPNYDRRLQPRGRSYQNMRRDELIKLLNSIMNGTVYNPNTPLTSAVRDQYDDYSKDDLIRQLVDVTGSNQYTPGADWNSS